MPHPAHFSDPPPNLDGDPVPAAGLAGEEDALALEVGGVVVAGLVVLTVAGAGLDAGVGLGALLVVEDGAGLATFDTAGVGVGVLVVLAVVDDGVAGLDVEEALACIFWNSFCMSSNSFLIAATSLANCDDFGGGI